MIKPTIGRIVWFHPDHAHPQPYAAIIAFVHSDTLVNLSVISHMGEPCALSKVRLIQPEEAGLIPSGEWAEWMPYQIGKENAAWSNEFDKAIKA